MRSFFLAAAVSALALRPAVAAPPPELPLDTLLARPGIQVLGFDQADACPDDRWTREVAEASSALGIPVARTPRDKATVAALLGKAHRTRAMTVALRDGARLDAICGCPSGDEVADWMRGLPEGRVWSDRLREGLTTAPLDVVGHFALYEAQRCAAHDDAAFGTLAVLWSLIPTQSPGHKLARMTRVAVEMGDLARRSESVTAQIRAMRDALDATKHTDRATMEDWVALNRVLLDDAATVAWFDATRSDPEHATARLWVGPLVAQLLVDAGRWADAGTLIDDVFVWRDMRVGAGTPELIAMDHVALLAAGRTRDARAHGLAVVSGLPDTAGGLVCAMLARATAEGFVHKDDKPLLRHCPDKATVDAWKAAL